MDKYTMHTIQNITKHQTKESICIVEIELLYYVLWWSAVSQSIMGIFNLHFNLGRNYSIYLSSGSFLFGLNMMWSWCDVTLCWSLNSFHSYLHMYCIYATHYECLKEWSNNQKICLYCSMSNYYTFAQNDCILNRTRW